MMMAGWRRKFRDAAIHGLTIWGFESVTICHQLKILMNILQIGK